MPSPRRSPQQTARRRGRARRQPSGERRGPGCWGGVGVAHVSSVRAGREGAADFFGKVDATGAVVPIGTFVRIHPAAGSRRRGEGGGPRAAVAPPKAGNDSGHTGHCHEISTSRHPGHPLSGRVRVGTGAGPGSARPVGDEPDSTYRQRPAGAVHRGDTRPGQRAGGRGRPRRRPRLAPTVQHVPGAGDGPRQRPLGLQRRGDSAVESPKRPDPADGDDGGGRRADGGYQ